MVLDTDVASLLLKDQVPSTLFARIAGQALAVTYVTVGELTKWTVARAWGSPRRTAMEHWLAQFPVLAATTDVGQIWGEVTARSEQRGRPRPVNDSWIAAVCLAHDIPLATLNVADFDDLGEHEGLRLVTA